MWGIRNGIPAISSGKTEKKHPKNKKSTKDKKAHSGDGFLLSGGTKSGIIGHRSEPSCKKEGKQYREAESYGGRGTEQRERKDEENLRQL
jgi:hypothetical protein